MARIGIALGKPAKFLLTVPPAIGLTPSKEISIPFFGSDAPVIKRESVIVKPTFRYDEAPTTFVVQLAPAWGR